MQAPLHSLKLVKGLYSRETILINVSKYTAASTNSVIKGYGELQRESQLSTLQTLKGKLFEKVWSPSDEPGRLTCSTPRRAWGEHMYEGDHMPPSTSDELYSILFWDQLLCRRSTDWFLTRIARPRPEQVNRQPSHGSLTAPRSAHTSFLMMGEPSSRFSLTKDPQTDGFAIHQTNKQPKPPDTGTIRARIPFFPHPLSICIHEPPTLVCSTIIIPLYTRWFSPSYCPQYSV